MGYAELESLLGGDALRLRTSLAEDTQALLERAEGRLVLFGAGALGRFILASLRRAGRLPEAFVDNAATRWGTTVEGIPVLSPEEALVRYRDRALFVVTVYTGGPVWAQLRDQGIEPIAFARLAWLWPAAFLPHGGVGLPDRLLNRKDEVRAAFEVWADGESREEYTEQVRWSTTLRPEVLRPHLHPRETYFPGDLFRLHEREVFVDCGAFDGDSLRAFLGRVEGRFQRAVGIEPDSENRVRFEAWRATLPPEQGSRIDLLPYAVGEASASLAFDPRGTAGSIVGQGDEAIEARPLDAILEVPPTFIKLDVEGAEPAALRGALHTIQTHRPILAVCLYHAPEHLFEIPLWLKAHYPDCTLHLRRYANECWERVCYAVPKERG